MVINKCGGRLYEGLVTTVTQHLQDIAKKVEATQGQAFMAELKLRWDDHTKSMQMIRDILMVCWLLLVNCIIRAHWDSSLSVTRLSRITVGASTVY